tara:strand:- start:5127 stop:6269 length:1143 start_codon:yes stop_codon:yes gene_type:complete
MAYKFQRGLAVLSGSLRLSGALNPDTDDAFDLGSTALQWKDLYIDGTAYVDALDLNGTAVSSTAAELNLLDAVTRGSIIYGNASGATARLAAGSANRVLSSDGTDISYTQVATAMIADDAVTLAKMAGLTRGSIIVGDSSGDPSALAKGSAAQFLQSDGTDPSYVSISGDATVAAGGALTIANDAVESGMLNDNVISGQTELAQGSLAAADEFLISDAGVLKKFGVDSLAKDALALVTEAAADVAADYIAFLDGGATGETKKESIADLVSSMAGGGLAASSGQLSVQGNTVTSGSNPQQTLVEGYNVFGAITGSIIADVPASPSVGDVVTVKAGNITNNGFIRITASAAVQIDGEGFIVVESAYGAVSLVYAGTNDWRII